MKFFIVSIVLFLISRINFIQALVGCPNRFESYFPKCNCTGDNFGWSYYDRECRKICPSMSDGEYPECKCRFSDPYDNVTNSCPNPICPPHTTADSIYPDCKCTGENFEYFPYLNECGRVCPENSTGRFPNCKCNDALEGFSRNFFVCKRCPPGSRIDLLYPNCKSSTNENATFIAYSNKYIECPPETYGIHPNCHCKNGNSFREHFFVNPYKNINKRDGYSDVDDDDDFDATWDANITKIQANIDPCAHCPNPKETYPNCSCKNEKFFDGIYCRQCPSNSSALHRERNCVCKGNETYVKEINQCLACPENSTGTYPKCTCDESLYFDVEANTCIECPTDSTTGSFPDCKCNNKNAKFVRKWMSCEECDEHSTGFYPNCICTKKNQIFSAYLNQCFIPCGMGAIGIYPSCYCGFDVDAIYDVKERTCKKIVYEGRPCPPGSIGIAPQCKCIRGFFVAYGWGCFHQYAPPVPIHYACDNWPHCKIPN